MPQPKPPRLYWLSMHNPDGRDMSKYRSRGGGKFTSLQSARARQQTLWVEHQVISTVYVSDLEWTELPDDESIYDMQAEPKDKPLVWS